MKVNLRLVQINGIGFLLRLCKLKPALFAVLLLITSLGPTSAQLRPGFIPRRIDAEPSVLFGQSTRGWNFGVNSKPIVITHLGIYDVGGDGLVSAHEVGMWANLNTGTPFLASAVVPAGTSAELIGDYRYVPISPVLVVGGAILGATYSLQDPDDVLRPIQGTFSAEIGEGGWGLVGYGPSLQVPLEGISRGQEGLPNYDFYHVNFLFQVVPEPHVTGLLILGLGGIFLLKRK